MNLAVTPLNDVSLWARTNLLVVILLVVGAILITRFATWVSNRITGSIDRRADQTDALVRSEAVKHRHAVTQVVTWATLVLIYCLTA
ncbi:MAG: MscS Mechanosensitive ion channel, partial [Jatrophihabitans sp.]|nr:MscS Mechanosensitive ion channel [Jatrophihabitans sp.]